jgi:hypothetical protein
MLDGDRIATLLAGYLQQLLKEADLTDKIRYQILGLFVSDLNDIWHCID